MTRLQNELEEHASLLINMSYRDARPRLTGFLNWLETTETTRQIVDGLKCTVNVAPLLEQAEDFAVQAGDAGMRFMLIAGPPLREPIAWGGPIVMNTRDELEQAFAEIDAGTFIRQ